jgi:hypothetical protein
MLWLRAARAIFLYTPRHNLFTYVFLYYTLSITLPLLR